MSIEEELLGVSPTEEAAKMPGITDAPGLSSDVLWTTKKNVQMKSCNSSKDYSAKTEMKETRQEMDVALVKAKIELLQKKRHKS